MSARVINPVMLAEFTKIRSPAIRGHLPSAGSLAKIKRDLFGPVDKEDSKRFVNAELAKHQLNASKRWGFDFARGFPNVDSSSSTQYIWERVPPTTAVPEVYTLSRAAHTRVSMTTASSCNSSSNYRNDTTLACHLPTMDELLDKRSERSNRSQISILNNADELPSTSSAFNTTTSIRRICSPTTNYKTLSPSPNRANIREKRQPKITDYLKERKRLTPTKKLSPSKKMTRTALQLMLRHH